MDNVKYLLNMMLIITKSFNIILNELTIQSNNSSCNQGVEYFNNSLVSLIFKYFLLKCLSVLFIGGHDKNTTGSAAFDNNRWFSGA